MKLMPGSLDDSGLDEISTFQEFDDAYTAPLHGFRDAEDYWHQCSSRRYLEGVRLPALLVNAKDDPFLAPECFPVKEATYSPCLFLEIPSSGGHVGFLGHDAADRYWMEGRALAFLNDIRVEENSSLA